MDSTKIFVFVIISLVSIGLVSVMPSADAASVSLPPGTTAPGCENTNQCYIPAMVRIGVGDTVTWSNDDSAPHTVTSGTAAGGPDGIFDSSLFTAGQTFSHTFSQSGTYDYFCMVHPWMTGVVSVQAASTPPPPSIPGSTSEIKFSKYNSNYGFSLNYPSGWYVDDEIVQYDDGSIDYVYFTAEFDDFNTFIRVAFYPNELGYIGLSDDAYRSKLVLAMEDMCREATLELDGHVCIDFDLFDSVSLVDEDENVWHLIMYLEEWGYPDGTSDVTIVAIGEMPSGVDVWSITAIFDVDFLAQDNYNADVVVGEILESFSLDGASTTQPTLSELSVEELVEKGVKAGDDGKWDEAIMYFDQALKIEPNNSNALVHNGILHGIIGNYEESLKLFERALAIDPYNPTAIEGKQIALEKLGRSDDNGNGCLIATATYGSELTPQVQLLREIRDNSLLQTESGSYFMESFNQFYYSFSPTIADLERENPAFKEIVKVSLTPLLTSLSILKYVEMDSEAEVLGYGISLILLNIGMYFIAPTVAIVHLKKRFH